MKVEFYFPEEPITGYGTNENPEQIEVNKTIKEKVHKKVIEIPCVPTKEMQVDISAFSEVFAFSKEEMRWINDCSQHHYITNVFIKPTHLEVWLEYTLSSENGL
jgi:hypothetical protein